MKRKDFKTWKLEDEKIKRKYVLKLFQDEKFWECD